MNKSNELYVIDGMLREGLITLTEAFKCWKMVRDGKTAVAALNVIQDRKVRKEEKKKMKSKKKNEKSLEELVQQLDTKSRLYEFVLDARLTRKLTEGITEKELELLQELSFPCEEWASSQDALNFVSQEVSEKLNSPQIGSDALDYCYSNTDGAEVLF